MAPLSAIDVAVYILKTTGPMSSMKLHKLVYYCQAWSIVWDGEPMFLDAIEAWVGGPATLLLYKASAGKFELRGQDLRSQARVKGRAAETVNAVLAFYGDREPVAGRLGTA